MNTTEMQNLIDWSAIMPMSRSAGGHDDQMQALFKGAKVLAHWNEGDYQGEVATAVQLADDRFAWYQDSYGSCSGCDSWEDADDEAVRALCIDLANSARVFDTYQELRADMRAVAEDKIKGIWWEKAAIELLRMLPEALP